MRTAALLAGEADADERDPRVIERWVTVYSELVRYKERLLPVTSTWAAAAVSPEAEREIARILNHRLLGESPHPVPAPPRPLAARRLG